MDSASRAGDRISSAFNPEENRIHIESGYLNPMDDYGLAMYGDESQFYPIARSDVAHEIWHAAQSMLPELLPLEWAFLKRNSTGESKMRLNTGIDEDSILDDDGTPIGILIDTPDMPIGRYATRRYGDGGPDTHSELGAVVSQSLDAVEQRWLCDGGLQRVEP